MTDSERVGALAARLDKVERQNRRLMWWMGTAWGFILVAIAIGALGHWRLPERASERPPSPRPNLEGASLWLWEGGRMPSVVVIPLRGSEKPDAVVLRLEDRLWGSPRAEFNMGYGQTTLQFLDRDEKKPRVVLSYGTDLSGLTLFDEKGKKRAELVCTKDGPALRLLDANGKPVFSAP
jgi:hypothetical protein